MCKNFAKIGLNKTISICISKTFSTVKAMITSKFNKIVCISARVPQNAR